MGMFLAHGARWTSFYREGRIKAIGVSNFHPDHVMDFIVHNEVAPAVDQIETHPFHQQVETQKFVTENNIQIESCGPFAEGKNNIFRNQVLVYWPEMISILRAACRANAECPDLY